MSFDQALREATVAAERNSPEALVPIVAALALAAREYGIDEFEAVGTLLDAQIGRFGQYAQCVRPLLEARAAAVARDERQIAACALRRLGYAYIFASDTVAALEALNEGLTEYRAIGDLPGEAHCLNNLGILWFRRDDPQESTVFLERALVLVEQINNPIERARVRINLGFAYKKTRRFAEGRRVLLEAVELLGASLPHIALIAHINLARLINAEGFPVEATARLDRFEALLKVTPHRFWETEMWLVRGHIATAEKRYADAKNALEKNLAMAVEDGGLVEQRDALVGLAENHAAAGEFEAAFNLTRQVAALDITLRRESALACAQAAAERKVAERAAQEVALAHANARATRQVLEKLEIAHRDLARVSEEKTNLLAALERQAREDPLTGLLNRRALNDKLAAELQRTHRHPRPLCLALLDLDNFKDINDTLSHIVGDQVLIQTARILEANRREGDEIARIGGEEFVILFPETTIDAACAACERLLASIRTNDWPAHGVKRSVTASLGVTQYRATEAPLTLLSRADLAMYAAKRGGKDRLMVG
jgi:diguanylate cyclase (GGDEF)-like protein